MQRIGRNNFPLPFGRRNGSLWEKGRLFAQVSLLLVSLDAVSAYTQVKLEDAPRLLKIPYSECPDVWMRLPRHKWPKSWSNIEDPVVPLERNLHGHGKDNSRKCYWSLDGKKYQIGMSVCSSKTRIILIGTRG